MANDKKFTELLDAYMAGTTNPEEVAELMWLIKTGSWDDLLRLRIDEALLSANNKTEFDETVSQQILSNIIKNEKPPIQLAAVDGGRKKWKWMAAAAVGVLLLSTAGWLIINKKTTGPELALEAPKPVPDTKKNKKYIHLADGSTVLLNEGSQLEYPDKFVGKTREVTLTGEGYFDIYHDESMPFIVHTGKVSTTVLGTAFNIKAYPGQKEIMVTVTRGKVKVSNDENTLGVITPNESISVNTSTLSFHQQKVNAEEEVAWKKQYLVLDDISLGDAAVLIDARYHVSISFSKEALKTCRISATFLDNETLEQVLSVVTGVVNARYVSQPNDQIIISGEGCN
ncbi:hypothetical protein BH11BAC3_BH11BAC3_25430 [soil metagenome]